MIIFPVIAFYGCLVAASVFSDSKRETLLLGSLGWGCLVAGITELLSLFGVFNFLALSISWMLTSLLLFGYAIYRKRPLFPLSLSFKQISTLKSSLVTVVASLVLILIAAVTLVTAAASVPNNPDSMSYHMSRVNYWIQHGSVLHYPTHTLQQLYQNPWAEITIAHFQLLAGSDFFAQWVQWFCMIGSLLGVSLIAQRLGANHKGQLLSAIICATLPMGILQSVSTQNDYVEAFWLVCFIYFAIKTVREGISTLGVTALAMAFGLAVLTKGTAYIYGFPIVLWLLISSIKSTGYKIWKPVIYAAVLVLLLNIGHYARNHFLFGSPLGLSVEEESISNQTIPLLASNTLKQLSLHADIVRHMRLDGFITPLTGVTQKILLILHDAAGIDINDPQIMSSKISKFYIPAFSSYEDTAGNPLHLFLFLLSILLLVFNRRIRERKFLFLYSGVVIAGFLMFCYFFSWSPWRCRLHLPLFVLASAATGTIIAKSFGSNRILIPLMIFLLFTGQPALSRNQLKPLVGEKSIFSTSSLQQYFTTKPHYEEPLWLALQAIEDGQCRTVGLRGDKIWYEYPIWIMSKMQDKEFQFVHVEVDNVSSELSQSLPPFAQTAPCYVLSFTGDTAPLSTASDTTAPSDAPLTISGKPYDLLAKNDGVSEGDRVTAEVYQLRGI
ncbi:MAG: glycosyltransferase family 39 protein [Cyanobacteria bacterium J06648_16]